jgi:hypothetical protein
MMEYLRALAPHHAHARHRAVVALRSRYDIDQPIRVAPRAVAPEVEHDEREAESSRERVNQPARPLEIDGVSPSLVADDEPRPRARRKSVAPAPSRAASASVASHPELETAVRTVPVENETLLQLPVTNQRPHPPPFVGSRPSERTTQPVPAAVPIPRESVAEASRLEQRSGGYNGPLSQLALASRVVPESDRPAIVHVTIDRVDVRAPAAPDRPAPRTRSRTATTGSLTDYLRARPAGRQGGPS